MERHEFLILDQMRQIISQSCENSNIDDHTHYEFQKAILKQFFKTADISIDNDKKQILLFTKEAAGDGLSRLFRYKDMATVSISFTNLEETLKGCLEEGPENLGFYSALMYQYKLRAADGVIKSAS